MTVRIDRNCEALYELVLMMRASERGKGERRRLIGYPRCAKGVRIQMK